MPRFFTVLYFWASCWRIKRFLLLRHIMHLPRALLRFSLQGIVCVKPTELKVLLRLLSPTPERQSCCRPFCILAAKCEKTGWRQQVQGLAASSFGPKVLYILTIGLESGALAFWPFLRWRQKTSQSPWALDFIHSPHQNHKPHHIQKKKQKIKIKMTCSEMLSKKKKKKAAFSYVFKEAEHGIILLPEYKYENI